MSEEQKEWIPEEGELVQTNSTGEVKFIGMFKNYYVCESKFRGDPPNLFETVEPLEVLEPLESKLKYTPYTQEDYEEILNTIYKEKLNTSSFFKILDVCESCVVATDAEKIGVIEISFKRFYDEFEKAKDGTPAGKKCKA